MAEPVSDDEIVDKVRLKLAADVRGTAFEVTVKEGVVTLRGQVDKEKNKKRAEKLAKKVKGVKSRQRTYGGTAVMWLRWTGQVSFRDLGFDHEWHPRNQTFY
jgi:hypothetical protein